MYLYTIYCLDTFKFRQINDILFGTEGVLNTVLGSRKKSSENKNISQIPSGKSLIESLDSSSRVTSTIACGKGFVNCSDKGVNTPMLMSTNLLSASLCTYRQIVTVNLTKRNRVLNTYACHVRGTN